MKLSLLGIILTVICGINAVISFQGFAEMTKGNSEMKRIKKEKERAIQVVNIQYRVSKYLASALLRLVGIGIIGYCCYIVKFNLYLMIPFAILIIVSLFDFIRFFILYKNGEFAYLTTTSLATIYGNFKKDGYRFEMERETSDGSGEAGYLNVYKGNIAYPMRFKIEENYEEAVQIINDYFNNSSSEEGNGI